MIKEVASENILPKKNISSAKSHNKNSKGFKNALFIEVKHIGAKEDKDPKLSLKTKGGEAAPDKLKKQEDMHKHIKAKDKQVVNVDFGVIEAQIANIKESLSAKKNTHADDNPNKQKNKGGEKTSISKKTDVPAAKEIDRHIAPNLKKDSGKLKTIDSINQSDKSLKNTKYSNDLPNKQEMINQPSAANKQDIKRHDKDNKLDIKKTALFEVDKGSKVKNKTAALIRGNKPSDDGILYSKKTDSKISIDKESAAENTQQEGIGSKTVKGSSNGINKLSNSVNVRIDNIKKESSVGESDNRLSNKPMLDGKSKQDSKAIGENNKLPKDKGINIQTEIFRNEQKAQSVPLENIKEASKVAVVQKKDSNTVKSNTKDTEGKQMINNKKVFDTVKLKVKQAEAEQAADQHNDKPVNSAERHEISNNVTKTDSKTADKGIEKEDSNSNKPAVKQTVDKHNKTKDTQAVKADKKIIDNQKTIKDGVQAERVDVSTNEKTAQTDGISDKTASKTLIVKGESGADVFVSKKDDTVKPVGIKNKPPVENISSSHKTEASDNSNNKISESTKQTEGINKQTAETGVAVKDKKAVHIKQNLQNKVSDTVSVNNKVVNIKSSDETIAKIRQDVVSTKADQDKSEKAKMNDNNVQNSREIKNVNKSNGLLLTNKIEAKTNENSADIKPNNLSNKSKTASNTAQQELSGSNIAQQSSKEPEAAVTSMLNRNIDIKKKVDNKTKNSKSAKQKAVSFNMKPIKDAAVMQRQNSVSIQSQHTDFAEQGLKRIDIDTQSKAKLEELKKEIKGVKNIDIDNSLNQSRHTANLSNTSTLPGNSIQIESKPLAYPLDKIVEHIENLQNSMKPPFDNSVTVRLNPPGLGFVEVRVKMKKDKQLSTAISADNKDVVKMIASHIDKLKDYLTSQGFRIEHIDIQNSFREHSNFGSGTQNGGYNPQQGQSGSQSRNMNETRQMMSNEAVREDIQETVITRDSQSGLDITV